jgi:acyl-CoA synthetase (AMP-forming)/AMP-acid ligase II
MPRIDSVLSRSAIAYPLAIAIQEWPSGNFITYKQLDSAVTNFASWCQSQEIQNEEVIAIHLRRGDYLQYSHHPVQTLEYYSKGLSHMSEDIPVMIFSDDIEWCKEQDLFQGDRFIFAEGNNTGVDLCLQSLCTYHIIANSSFSWWGSWLAKSKKTVAPSTWFAGPNASKDLSDLYLPKWIII